MKVPSVTSLFCKEVAWGGQGKGFSPFNVLDDRRSLTEMFGYWMLVAIVGLSRCDSHGRFIC